jgi:DNA modification methylase
MRGRYRLIQGDCLEVLPRLPRGSVNAVVCDPPYGIGYAHSGQAGKATFGGPRFHYAHRRNTASIVGDEAPFDPSPWLAFPIVLFWGADHFRDRLPAGGTFIGWDKSLGRGPNDSFVDCEFAWTNVRVKRNLCRYLWKGLLSWKRGEENGRRYHPTQKPIGLMRWCLDTLGIERGATVLDPYMGVGSTGLACVQTGRRFLGVEIDSGYFKIARDRIRKAAHATRKAVPA